mgnify:CR=1 FL=1
MVEVRGVDLNKLSETDEVIKAISDIPDYCTVVFLCEPNFEPDKRLKLYKTFAKAGVEIHVTAQLSDALIKWIVKRFAAQDKSIELNAAQRLITVSGEQEYYDLIDAFDIRAFILDTTLSSAPNRQNRHIYVPLSDPAAQKTFYLCCQTKNERYIPQLVKK